MSEIVAAEEWLTTVLGADAALGSYVGNRIYSHVVPDGAAYPYVWMTNQSNRDVMGIGTNRVMVNEIYTVRGVALASSFVELELIADRIDAVLHAASGVVVRGTVLGCVRQAPFVMVDPAKGVQYRQLGGIYRLWVQ